MNAIVYISFEMRCPVFFLHKTLIFNVLYSLIPIELMLIKKLNNRT